MLFGSIAEVFIPRIVFDVPDVFSVQEVPSVEVRIIPDVPTITKMLFPYVTP